MGTNKNAPSSERTFFNGSPSNKKYSSGTQQRPSPSKSINIKTPCKNQSSNVAGLTNNNNSSKRLSGSCSPPNFSYFAGSKCFESPSPQSLPKPPTSWFDDESGMKNGSFKATGRPQRARKSLNLSAINSTTSCATEYARQQNSSFTSINNNDHYTQNLKLLLNVNA
ncbi:CLUMA_CG018051, isoform A [Clunio marinus]|uniref:CLUMA_CG018051, isoform A n=1 Tax=Clunio marinus TaxID=568069 RepID=A0A1J1J1M1_9DIPT|nr:CLUMA_CG018051, isoform A [Clunio marinus]